VVFVVQVHFATMRNMKSHNEDNHQIKKKNKVYSRRPSSHHFCSISLLLLLLHPCYWLPSYTSVITLKKDPSHATTITNTYHRNFAAAAATVTPSPSPLDEEASPDKGENRAPVFGRILSLVSFGNVTTTSSSSLPSSTSRETKEASTTNKGSLTKILTNAGKRGIGGGIPGAIAGAVQVLTLMWLRTVINYQCRYGTTFRQALTTLYNQGGLPRFYRGLTFAIIQAPLARFVSTAANDGIESLLSNLQSTKHWGPGRNTFVASIVVGIWRVILMPIDTCKTVLQVDSAEGFRNLMRKVRMGKIHVLYQGAVAQVITSVGAHYPWFYTYKMLSRHSYLQTHIKNNLVRNGAIGFFASIVSDVLVNVVRVIKTTKQAIGSKHTVTYGETIAMVLAADGWRGLFGRGLKTRILANALQSVVFTIIWNGLSQRWSSSSNPDINQNNEKRSHEQKNDDTHVSAQQSDNKKEEDYIKN